MRFRVGSLLCLIFFLSATGQVLDPVAVTQPELFEHAAFLASDALEGRKPGTDGGRQAAGYVRDDLRQSGLTLLGESGFQFFDVVTDIVAGDGNALAVDGTAVADSLFVPLAFSRNDSVAAAVTFCGFGLDVDTDSLRWSDYDGIEVSGRWVLLLRGHPEWDRRQSDFDTHTDVRKKVLTARDRGAAGVLLVAGPTVDTQDALPELRYETGQQRAGLPVIQIKRALADRLLAPTGRSTAEWESAFQTDLRPQPTDLGTRVNAQVDLVYQTSRTQNVVAMLEAEDATESIVIGAHYDHLGYGGPGSGSRRPDTVAVHNGADDNASGVAGLLELAEALAARRDELKRHLVFVAFGAEEMGTLGSRHFMEHRLPADDSIAVMINLDMIGRLDADAPSISVTGTGTAVELEAAVMAIAESARLPVQAAPEGYGPSDHASFYQHDIPVLSVFTGAHADYHTPFDDVDRLNVAGMESVCRYVEDLTVSLANRDGGWVFQQAGPKSPPKPRRRMKVTLGIMPDHAATDVEGLRVSLVMPDRPAELGGMKKGDVIVAIEGKPILNIYDYMNRLGAFHSGQRINVDVVRDGEHKVLIIEL